MRREGQWGSSIGGGFIWDSAPPFAAGLGLTPTGGRDGDSFFLVTPLGWGVLLALVLTSMSGPLRIVQHGSDKPGGLILVLGGALPGDAAGDLGEKLTVKEVDKMIRHRQRWRDQLQRVCNHDDLRLPLCA